MSHVIILAGSAKEANAYRRDFRLPTGRAVYASSAGLVDGIVPSQIHTLPGFAKRRDQHAIKAALKRTRRKFQNIVEVTFDERGFLSERDLVVAHRYNALRDQGIPEDVDPVIAMAAVSFTPEDLVAEQALEVIEEVVEIATESPSDDIEQKSSNDDTPAPRRRRSKCKDCQTLHFKDEDCPPPANPDFFEV